MLLSNGCCVMKCQLFMSTGQVRHCWVMSRYRKGKNLFFFVGGLDFCLQKQLREGCLNIVLWVSSLKEMCFEVCDVLFK